MWLQFQLGHPGICWITSKTIKQWLVFEKTMTSPYHGYIDHLWSFSKGNPLKRYVCWPKDFRNSSVKWLGAMLCLAAHINPRYSFLSYWPSIIYLNYDADSDSSDSSDRTFHRTFQAHRTWWCFCHVLNQIHLCSRTSLRNKCQPSTSILDIRTWHRNRAQPMAQNGDVKSNNQRCVFKL